jgi:hypothetical protein
MPFSGFDSIDELLPSVRGTLIYLFIFICAVEDRPDTNANVVEFLKSVNAKKEIIRHQNILVSLL